VNSMDSYRGASGRSSLTEVILGVGNGVTVAVGMGVAVAGIAVGVLVAGIIFAPQPVVSMDRLKEIKIRHLVDLKSLYIL
jgi:hypothetical protein